MIYYVTGQRELFGWYSGAKYKCITVEESFEVLNSLSIVGLDTETTGTEIWTGRLLLLQLGNKENQVVIDCTTIDINQYKDYLESNRLFIIHNAKFDLRWLYKEHIVVRNVYDTYLGEKILFLGFPPGIVSLSLQACCDRYLHVYLDKTVRGKIHAGVTEEVIVYAANDVVYLEDIMNAQMKIIAQRGQQNALEIENKFVRVLAYIEFCGIKLDPSRWKAKMVKDEDRLRVAEQKLNDWVVKYVLDKDDPSLIQRNYDSHKKGKPTKLKESVYVVIPAPSLFSKFDTGPQCIINWSSSKQVIRLFKELGFDLLVKDKKTGKMKESVESKYIEMQKDKSDIVPLYLEYSAAFKVVTSFGQNFLDAINPITQRIHPTFNQMMDTGRLSCGSGGKGRGGKTKDDDIAEEDEDKNTTTQTNDKSVNIQQLPATEETRAAFVPEKGHLLVDCDYGDQEGHVFTELSNDREWIAFYNDPNERDGHSFVAKMCFPKDLDGIEEKQVKKVRKDLRDLAKKARFCFNYNGQAPTMAANCNIPVDFATEIQNNYFKRFNGIASYFKVQKRDMWDRGYILISKITGLRAYIYDYPILKGIERRKNSMGDSFWDIYKAARDSGRVIPEIPPSVMQEIAKKFAQGVPIEEIAIRYSYKVKKAGKVEEKFIDINRETVYVSVMKHLWKRKSASDNQSCNYPLIVGAYSSDAI